MQDAVPKALMHFLVLKVQRGLQQHLITTMYRYGSPGDTQSTQGAMLGLKAVSTYCRKAQPSCMHRQPGDSLLKPMPATLRPEEIL